MTVDTLEMAQAMRRSGLPQEQADTIAEQIGKGFRSDDLATKEFVRGEIAKLELFRGERKSSASSRPKADRPQEG